jgi:hypothetical protein
MRSAALILAVVLLSLVPAAAKSSKAFVMCPAGGAFADCTQAQCTTGANGTYSCSCTIRRTESAMAQQQDASQNCLKATATTVQSRFAPVRYAQLCGQDYQGPHYYPSWAWCMAALCTKTGAHKASCSCVAPPAGSTQPYVVMRSTNGYSPRQCIAPPKVWSSATEGEAQSIQHFMGAPPMIITNKKRH